MERIKRRVHCFIFLTLILVTSDSYAWPFSKKVTQYEHVVENLDYGQALYHYYMGASLNALTLLEINKSQKADSSVALKTYPYPEILNSSLSLTYGLTKKADRQLKRLSSENLPLEAQHQLNFYLGKIAFYRGKAQESLDALQNIPHELEFSFKDEALYYQARTLMDLGDMDQALKMRAEFSENSAWLPYLDYSLLLTQRQEQKQMAPEVNWRSLNDRLASYSDGTKDDQALPEFYGLYERAVISQSLAMLHSDSGTSLTRLSQDSLNQVRKTSPWLDSALFATGLSAFQAKNPSIAEAAWKALLEQPLDSDEKNAARSLLLSLNVPSSSSPTNNQSITHKLKEYQDSIDFFKKQIQDLDAITNPDRFGLWFDQWINSFLESGHLSLPSRHTAWINWLSKQSNRALLQNIKEVHELNSKLNNWKQTLPTYKTMIQNRETAQRERLAAVSFDKLSEQYQKYQAAYDRLKPIISSITPQQAPWILASEEIQDYRNRILANENRLEKLAAARLLNEEEAKVAKSTLRISRGLLIWQLEIDRPALLWKNKKSLIQIRKALASTNKQLESINSLLVDKQPFQYAYAEVNQLFQRVQSINPKIAGIQSGLREQLAAKIKAELIAQMKQSETYLSYTTYERARLFDRYWQINKTEQDTNQKKAEQP